ncbi:SpaH/EbpB family LPXTG-anchored major pilin [Cellulosimicrobium funkei]|nr:SpaH/EbpB family LPXTG-anchored major pilin [Cellulosimicrobium funkei]
MKKASMTWRSKLAAVTGLLGLGMASLSLSAVPASAAELGPNLDPEQTGSISITKLTQPEGSSGLPNDGSALTPEQLDGQTPLEGVTFQLQSVGGIDLSTNAGWDEVEDLTAADVLADPTAYPLTDEGSQATDANGQVSYGDLPLGVYLVTETDAGGNPIAELAPPFLVTMPMPTGDNTWLYDVNVYPKNAVTNATKTVDDSDAYGIGDNITWSITGSVPYLADGDTMDRFQITDTLDSRLGYTSATITAVDAAGAQIALDSADYTLTAPAAGSTGTVDVTFTEAGLAKLQANQGAVVTMDLVTEILSLGDGAVENTVTIFTNDADPTATASSSWGALAIFKYATVEGTNEALEGAEFQVFTSEADAQDQANPVTVDGQDTFTSDAAGDILIAGLKAGDYWVVETAAPAGYQANATPMAVTVTEGSQSEAVVLEVENTQVPEWMLPLTGSAGTIYFIIAGGLLILAGIIAAVVSHRRKAHA